MQRCFQKHTVAWCIKSELLQLWSRATLSCFLLHSQPETCFAMWTVKALFGLPAVPKICREVQNVKAKGIVCTLNSRWLDVAEDTGEPQHAWGDSAAGSLYVWSGSCLENLRSNARWSPTFNIKLHYPPSGNLVKTSCLTVMASISQILSSIIPLENRTIIKASSVKQSGFEKLSYPIIIWTENLRK